MVDIPFWKVGISFIFGSGDFMCLHNFMLLIQYPIAFYCFTPLYHYYILLAQINYITDCR